MKKWLKFIPKRKQPEAKNNKIDLTTTAEVYFLRPCQGGFLRKN